MTLGAVCLLILSSTAASATVDVPADYDVLQPVDAIAPVDRTRLSKRVERPWRAPALGSLKAGAIDAYASSEQPEWGQGADRALMPASTTKLLTAAAVLKVFGPDHRFATSVVADGDRIVLVGGGDPQLTSFPSPPTGNASLVRLARVTAQRLQEAGAGAVTLGYDDSLFAPPQKAPFWGPDYLRIGVVAPISALSTDGGRRNPPASPRAQRPAAVAARQFANLLSARGVVIESGPLPAAARGEEIAQVQSPPLADLVEHMLLVSDNTEADILAHHVGKEVLDDPTFNGGARATLQVLEELGIDVSGIVLQDGSGLARANRITPNQLLAVLRAAMQTDPGQLWPVYTGLPVAGFDGSLTYRFSSPSSRPGRGNATGKTGTLTGTSTLAGLVSDRDGRLLTYALMSNNVSQWAASGAIDEVVARVAGCRCGTGGSASPSAG